MTGTETYPPKEITMSGFIFLINFEDSNKDLAF